MQKAILTKTRKTSFTSQTGSIRKVNLNLKANVITNLATNLGFLFKHPLAIKNVLYMVKKVISLQITHNKTVMTKKSVLASSFQSTKASLVMSVIYKTI